MNKHSALVAVAVACIVVAGIAAYLRNRPPSITDEIAKQRGYPSARVSQAIDRLSTKGMPRNFTDGDLAVAQDMLEHENSRIKLLVLFKLGDAKGTECRRNVMNLVKPYASDATYQIPVLQMLEKFRSDDKALVQVWAHDANARIAGIAKQALAEMGTDK